MSEGAQAIREYASPLEGSRRTWLPDLGSPASSLDVTPGVQHPSPGQSQQQQELVARRSESEGRRRRLTSQVGAITLRPCALAAAPRRAS